MKKLIYIALLLLFGNSLIGQNKLTNALYSLKNNELDKAKLLIDAAAEDTLFQDKAATWYYRGFIYKNLFKENESSNKQSPLRLKSIEYFKKSLEIEPEGTYAESTKKGMTFLAQTIYNHSATSFDPENYELAISNYELYKEVMRVVEPESDFTSKDVMFNLALATTFGRIAEEDKDSTKRATFTDKAKKLYEEVLKMDPNNISANYNLGIIYYNEGVEIVNNMDYSLDLFELNAVQDRIIELFKESLPYMKKAYELNPKRKETLIGLQGIYFSLNDIEKSEAFKKELEELESTEGSKTVGTPTNQADEAPQDIKLQDEAK